MGANSQVVREITVREGESIQDAIDRAPEGGHVILGKGSWRESLTIRKSLYLRGQGANLSGVGALVIDGSPREAASGRVALTGKKERRMDRKHSLSVHVGGLSVSSDATTSGVRNGILLLGIAEASIRQCEIRGFPGRGISIRSSGHATVKDCRIFDSEQGVEVLPPMGRRVHVRIAACRLTGNQSAGICVVGNARARISECEIQGSSIGVHIRGVDGRVRAQILTCTVSGNDRGICVDFGKAAIRANQIDDNRRYGLGCWWGGVVGATNVMRGNGVDIVGNAPKGLRASPVPATESKVEYPDRRFASLQEAIDALQPNGELVIREGEFEAGLTIYKPIRVTSQAGSPVTLKARDPHAPAVSVISGGRLHATSLTIVGGDCGLAIGGTGQAVLDGCEFLGGRRGIDLRGKSRAQVTGSVVRKTDIGLHLHDCGLARVRQSEISDCSGSGVSLRDGAKAEVVGSNIARVSHGLWLQDRARLVMAGCTVSARDTGVLMQHWVRARLTSNRISAAGGNYGLALLQPPCFYGVPRTAGRPRSFRGRVAGRHNEIRRICPPCPGPPWPACLAR